MKCIECDIGHFFYAVKFLKAIWASQEMNGADVCKKEIMTTKKQGIQRECPIQQVTINNNK
jgi:hypothetical protein